MRSAFCSCCSYCAPTQHAVAVENHRRTLLLHDLFRHMDRTVSGYIPANQLTELVAKFDDDGRYTAALGRGWFYFSINEIHLWLGRDQRDLIHLGRIISDTLWGLNLRSQMNESHCVRVEVFTRIWEGNTWEGNETTAVDGVGAETPRLIRGRQLILSLSAPCPLSEWMSKINGLVRQLSSEIILLLKLPPMCNYYLKFTLHPTPTLVGNKDTTVSSISLLVICVSQGQVMCVLCLSFRARGWPTAKL